VGGNFGFNTVTMESEKYICVREENAGVKEIVIIDTVGACLPLMLCAVWPQLDCPVRAALSVGVLSMCAAPQLLVTPPHRTIPRSRVQHISSRH
jgi:hypothetical protein